MSFKFSAPIKPISVNQAVRHGKWGSYKSKELKEFWGKIFKELATYRPIEIDHSLPVTMLIQFTLPREEFFTKDGKVAKRHDLDNLQKYTIDAVSKYLNFNDSLICLLTSIKAPGDKWNIDVEVRQDAK